MAWVNGRMSTRFGYFISKKKCARQQVLSIHPNLTSFNNLVSVLTDQAKYEEAKEMHRQALGLGETVLAKEHPSTLMSVHCLAHLLHLQQRPSEADPLYQTTLTGYDKTLGSDHSTIQACRRSYLFISKGMDELDTEV